MNIFEMLPSFGEWTVVENRVFNAEELAQISSAVIAKGDYGYSAKINFIDGGYTYIPLSNASRGNLGEAMDVTKARLLTLSKKGCKDIYRVEW